MNQIGQTLVDLTSVKTQIVYRVLHQVEDGLVGVVAVEVQRIPLGVGDLNRLPQLRSAGEGDLGNDELDRASIGIRPSCRCNRENPGPYSPSRNSIVFASRPPR